jgi:hypothetical protein
VKGGGRQKGPEAKKYSQVINCVQGCEIAVLIIYFIKCDSFFSCHFFHNDIKRTEFESEA